MNTMRLVTVAGLSLAVLSSTQAFALDVVGSEIENKRFSLDNKHEVFIQVPLSTANRFTSSSAVGLQYLYHLGEYLAFGLDGAFAFSADETGLAKQIRLDAEQKPLNRQELALHPRETERRLIQYWAGPVVHWYPLYGKWSLAATWDMRWDLFLAAGGGITGYKTMDPFEEPDGKVTGAFSTSTKPNANAGLGMRWHFHDNVALRVEYKGLMIFDEGVNSIDEASLKTGGEKAVSLEEAKTVLASKATKGSSIVLVNYIVLGISLLF